jgi:hypothetical protein
MENYRMELDALNALVRAQHRTNELLEKFLEREESHKKVETDKKNIIREGQTGKRTGRKPRVPA